MESSQHQVSTTESNDPFAGYVQVGVISGVHGYDGRVRIQPDSDNPGRFQPGAELWIDRRKHVVQHIGGTRDTVLVKLAGIDARDAARELLHKPVLVPPTALPSLPEGTYYHYELIDLLVRTSAGEELGRLTEVINTGANDVYVVKAAESELLLPAIGDVVRDVNVEEGLMTVAVPEGLEWRQLRPARPDRKTHQGQRKRPARKRPPDDP